MREFSIAAVGADAFRGWLHWDPFAAGLADPLGELLGARACPDEPRECEAAEESTCDCDQQGWQPRLRKHGSFPGRASANAKIEIAKIAIKRPIKHKITPPRTDG